MAHLLLRKKSTKGRFSFCLTFTQDCICPRTRNAKFLARKSSTKFFIGAQTQDEVCYEGMLTINIDHNICLFTQGGYTMFIVFDQVVDVSRSQLVVDGFTFVNRERPPVNISQFDGGKCPPNYEKITLYCWETFQ